MTSLRRLLGLPRLSIRIYILVLLFMLALAYSITGPAYRLFTKLQSTLGYFYEPKDLERGELLKTLQQEKR